MLRRVVSLPALAAGMLLLASACAPASGRPASAPVPLPTREDPRPAAEPPPAVRPSRDLQEVVRAGRFDLPIEANPWVAAELDFLVGQRASVIGGWLQRWAFYREFVEQVFRAHGLPTDLQHLGMVESGYVPTARSHAGAVGLWQFMPATGREMGLRIDSLVDERMDPVRSTVAAARHLRQLHRSFGDWPLATAAYNAGGGRVRSATQRAGTRSFWGLVEAGFLAQESRTYVPRLYAVTIISHQPERWGFQVPDLAGRRFAFDSVRTDLATPLPELARIAGVSALELARLNPHLVRGATPPGSYWVWVPAGSGTAAQEAFLASDFRQRGGAAPYRLREGDDLSLLSRITDLDAERLALLNPGASWGALKVGQTVQVPADAARVLAARPTLASRPALVGQVAAAPTIVAAPVAEHTVRPGDTLFSLSRRYGATVDAIRAANRLDGDGIAVGQTLVIPR